MRAVLLVSRVVRGVFLVLSLALIPGVGAAVTVSPPQRQTPGSNIVVADCDPHRHTAAQAHPWIDPYGVWQYPPYTFPSWDAFLGITYKNEAAVAATEVDFGLVSRGNLVAVAKDVGRFSTGASVDHEFVISREILPVEREYCAVLQVKYADGSTWKNPAPPEP
jgi:hypothetical protein